jgi:hypothetical protein
MVMFDMKEHPQGLECLHCVYISYENFRNTSKGSEQFEEKRSLTGCVGLATLTNQAKPIGRLNISILNPDCRP